MIWALYALHGNEAAVAVRGLVDPALPSSPHLATFWWSSTLAAVWSLARLCWSLPEQAFLRSRDRAVGKRTLLKHTWPWLLGCSAARFRTRALPPAEVARWTPVRGTPGCWAFPSHRAVPKNRCTAVTVQRSTVYPATPQLQQLSNSVADAVSVRQGCLLRAIPSFFRAKNGPCFFSDCPAVAEPSALVLSPNSSTPKPCCVG